MIWSEGWKSVVDLGLEDKYMEVSNSYLDSLKEGRIGLSDKEDELVWTCSPFDAYTPKLGYIHMNMDRANEELKWWWKMV